MIVLIQIYWFIFFSILVACHYVLILDLLLKKVWGRDEISQSMFTPYKPLCVPLSIFDYFFFHRFSVFLYTVNS